MQKYILKKNLIDNQPEKKKEENSSKIARKIKFHSVLSLHADICFTYCIFQEQ